MSIFEDNKIDEWGDLLNKVWRWLFNKFDFCFV